LKAHGISPATILNRPTGSPPSSQERALLKEIGNRAERYYESAQALIPLIDKESRPALWVLVRIYHALLQRIGAAQFDVFTRRASVPLVEKLTILSAGLARMAWARVVG
jgi:15-cis-phytoene synthase